MRLRDRLAAFIAGRQAGDPRAADERYWSQGGLQASASGVVVTLENALQLGPVQTVLEGLASPISTLPLGVFRKDRDGAAEKVKEHPVHALFSIRPNAWQTAQEFRDELVRQLAFRRNAYAEIVPGPDGEPVGALEPIHPDRVILIERRDGRVWYTIAPAAGGRGGGQRVLRDDQVWHIRKAPLDASGLRGLPMHETAREVFGRAIAVTEYGSRFFRNSGRAGGIIKHPGRFETKEDEAAFLESWHAASTGANAHRDRILKFGLDYKPGEMKNNEAQFLETEAAADIRIFGLWNFPPHRASRLERANLANVEQMGIDFVVYTLAPYIAAIEQAIGRDLLNLGAGEAGLYAEHNVAGLLRGDAKSRFAAYATARQWGWLSVNDIRGLENLPGIGPAGDRYLEPANMIEAGDDPAGDPPPPAGSEDAPAQTDESDDADPA